MKKFIIILIIPILIACSGTSHEKRDYMNDLDVEEKMDMIETSDAFNLYEKVRENFYRNDSFKITIKATFSSTENTEYNEEKLGYIL